MFEHMTNDNVSLVKQSGEEFENIKAYVQSNSILIEDPTLPIEEGDFIFRKLPNGLSEKYTVLDRGFNAGVAGQFAHYQIKVRKDGTISEKERQTNITFNLHGTQSKVNINSHDNSTNIINETNETVFTELRQAIQNNIQEDSAKELLLAKMDELEKSKGTKNFLEKYKDFMDIAKTHIDIIAPYIPALTQLLS